MHYPNCEALLSNTLQVLQMICLNLVRISDGLVTDLVQGIRGVGDQLTQKDLLVGVEGIDDEASRHSAAF